MIESDIQSNLPPGRDSPGAAATEFKRLPVCTPEEFAVQFGHETVK